MFSVGKIIFQKNINFYLTVNSPRFKSPNNKSRLCVNGAFAFGTTLEATDYLTAFFDFNIMEIEYGQ